MTGTCSNGPCQPRVRARTSAVLLACLVAGVLGVGTRSAGLQPTPSTTTTAADRSRLTQAHGRAVEAVAHLEVLPLESTPTAALDAVATTLEAMLADHAATVFRDDLRAQMAAQARAARALAARSPARADLAASRVAAGLAPATLATTLERVRLALGGALTPGLTFQGSFSQAKPKEESVQGGHATAMGPAPTAVPASGPPVISPVTFHERVTLPARTWAGGPTKDHILESAGSGVALVDVDGDGLLDIYLVTAAQLDASRTRIPHRNVLYRNLGDWRFEDVSARAGVDGASWGTGVCAGDVDGDGHVDLYVTNWGPNFLFRNRGDGRFAEVATTAGVAADGWSTGCAFLDADGDGDLDLYVARYVAASDSDLRGAQRTLRWRNGPAIMVGPAGLPGEADLYFENLGNGTFREATEAAGLADRGRAYGFGVVAADLDLDGHVDLFVANDSNPNFLYRNRGGRFESVGLTAGVGVNAEARAQAGMGADVGDADGDGRPDLTLTAFAHDRNTLYRNLGDLLFEDASQSANLAVPTFARMGWGVAFLDADLDGRQDLVVANGHIFADIDAYPALGETFAQRNQLLLNVGGRFTDVSATAGPGLAVEKVSRGLAVGDLDNDGDPDVVIANMDDVPTVLENRQATGHGWVGVALRSPDGNRLGIGAVVRVTAGGRTQIGHVRSGGSFLSQHDLRVLVGLGRHEGPVDVDVQMPGGARWRWRGLAVNRYHTLTLTDVARIAGDAR